MQDSYLTVKQTSEGLYKEKGSKFIAFVYPVISEDKVKEKLTTLRKEYYDARHHCYAYVLGNEGKNTRANDDGEPNHSAGDPILGQIKSRGLTNTLIVVIRYFGGTKLGVSGLIHAYKTAASEALDQNKFIEKDIVERYRFRFSYESMNEIMRLVKELNVQVENQGFDEQCTLDVSVKISAIDFLKSKVKLMQNLGHTIKMVEV